MSEKDFVSDTSGTEERVRNEQETEVCTALEALKLFKEKGSTSANADVSSAIKNLSDNLAILEIDLNHEDYREFGISNNELPSLIANYQQAELKR